MRFSRAALGRAVKRRLRAAAAPAFFLALTSFFAWSAASGDRGLMAQRKLRAEFAAARVDAGRAQAEARAWQHKVDSLSGAHLDPDALDEQARRMLNLANPADLVVPYGPSAGPAGKPAAEPAAKTATKTAG